jgi:archaeosortase A (PGF-CTERM-specific)
MIPALRAFPGSAILVSAILGFAITTLASGPDFQPRCFIDPFFQDEPRIYVQMIESALFLVSCISFIVFLLLTHLKRTARPESYGQSVKRTGTVRVALYAGTTGWACMVLLLFAELPYYLSINNFLYPTMALLSVPFLYITAKYLLRGDGRMIQLTMAASVAFLIYAPFEYLSPLGNWLMSVVVGQVLFLLDALHYPALLSAWNIIARNSLRVEIILACTGIQSIAIMLGITAAVPTTTRQKVLAFLLVVPTIYVLNLMRNAFVIIAYTGQWFPYFPSIAGNGEFGYESFFWAHHVIAEALALVVLILIAYGLFRTIPQLGAFAESLYQLYNGEIRKISGRDSKSAAPPKG